MRNAGSFDFSQISPKKRFGRTYLELDTFPGRQSELLKAKIVAPAALGDEKTTNVVLCCNRNYEVSSSKRGTSVRTQTFWKKEIEAQVARGQTASGEILVKFELPLPAELPDSSWGSSEWFTWTLKADASLKGADFEAEFEVPVFQKR